MTATPRPWKLLPDLDIFSADPSEAGHVRIACVFENPLARPRGGDPTQVARANGEFIVRAVNSFDAMREALQLIVAWNRSGGASSLEEARELTYRKAQAALALANGSRER